MCALLYNRFPGVFAYIGEVVMSFVRSKMPAYAGDAGARAVEV